MGQQEIHLVGQDLAALQVDILGVGRCEGNGQQFHAGLFRCSAGLVVVASLAGCHHVYPGILPALAEWIDMIARQQGVGKLVTAIQA